MRSRFRIFVFPCLQVLEFYGEITPQFKNYLYYDLLQIEKGMGTLTQTI